MDERSERRERRRERMRAYLTGAASGLVASAVVGGVDRLLDRYISPQQRLRERLVRPAPPHHRAGPVFAEKLLGHGLSARGERSARTAFNAVYGIGWGLIYTAVRRNFPALARFGGLPFGVLFFLACDGVIAPRLKLTPGLRKIPWQPNAKELANHVAWTAAAEATQRGAARAAAATA